MVPIKSIPRRLFAMIGALIIVVAACGDGGSSNGNDGATNDNPPIAGSCEVGTPDCNDTPGPPTGDELPPDEPGDSSGMLANGGLTVEEARTTDATGILAVRGFVVADGNSIRLCDALAESMPPQCGDAGIELANLDTVDPDSLMEAQGVQWTDDTVVIFGEIVDGVLVPAGTVTG